ncbi:hypothetical protein J3R83DRAFT_1799 [Lanmaoa asiatica]|nr:hypothetical protein J3R83DRAFT_1799 [Lanmaoa asiatica]
MVVTPVPLPAKIDYAVQSVPVPGTKRPGQTAHYRNALFGLYDASTPQILKTLPEVFDNGYCQNPDARLLGHRPLISIQPLKFGPYVWQTYKQVDARRRKIGSALYELFKSGVLKAEDLETVGIWSQNRPEWQIVELALHAYGKVGVSLYDTLGIDSSSLSIVFTTPDHIPTLLRMSSKIPVLKMIVSFDPLDKQIRHALVLWGETVGVQIKDLSEIESFGEAHLMDPLPASVDQIASLCYTSGTTNRPKGDRFSWNLIIFLVDILAGAVLTHGNLATSTNSNMFGSHYPSNFGVLSYLPLAHIYERVVELTTIAIGAVPRVLNRVYQSAMAAGNVPGLKGAIFRMAVRTKLDQLHATGIKTHPLWDYLVFSKIRAVLGGNVTLVSTGSAPIRAEVIDFLKIALLCEKVNVSLRYGMTENCGTCAHTIENDPTSGGTIGPPQAVNELKLVDVPAMNYTSEDKPNPRGELCVRGTNCFIGYYQDEKNTYDTLKDGWIHTGDVAEVDSQGRFRIIDRVKNIMKLAQGEYVALEKIENTYSSCPIVQQIYVHGDSLQSYLLAVVIPDPVVLAPLVSAIFGRKITADDIKALKEAVKDPRVIQEVLELLNEEATKNRLVGFEFVKRVHLSMDPFSVEENTLTPTFKLRRKDAYAKYKAELDALYALGDLNGEPSKL